MEEDRYTRITLRIPRELHALLEDEADRTSKSLNAEIVARLQESFAESAAVVQQFLDSALAAAQSRAALLDMRGDVLKSRMDSLDVRRRLMAVEAKREIEGANTDEDFERARQSELQVAQVSRELSDIRIELKALQRDRFAAVQEIDRLTEELAIAREMLVKRRDAYQKRKTADDDRPPGEDVGGKHRPAPKSPADPAQRTVIRKRLKTTSGETMPPPSPPVRRIRLKPGR